MLGVLCLMIAERATFAEIATLRIGEEPTFLAWRPHARSLWYSQGAQLLQWPSGRRITMPIATEFSPTGSNMLFRTSDDALRNLNIPSQRRSAVAKSVSSWSWSGGHLFWIQDEFTPKERQWFCSSASKRLLPSRWWIGAFDLQSGLAIARRPGALAPPQVVKFDQHSLKSRAFRKLSFSSEYPSNDSISWNKTLKLGLATYSGDSGGSTTTMEVFSSRRARTLGDLTFVESGPEWYGSKVLVDLRDFVDIGPGTSGSDTYSVVLLDPISLKRSVIAKRVVRFLPSKTAEEVNRSTEARMNAPRLGAVAASEDGRIAYVSGSKSAWIIHILAPVKFNSKTRR